MASDSSDKTGAPVVIEGRRYALGLLLALYLSNYLDRQILAILLEPIKLDLGLSDTQLGFMSGIAFALFFATLGLPIAMWADRTSRRNVVTISLVVWSGMTVLCGFAVNFWQLALARIGVAVGEAGGAPPAHSMISDLYAPHERATAMAIYSLGAPFGIFFGFLIGGWVNVEYGWRVAFFVVGAPGLVLAAVIRFTMREPKRGGADGIQDTGDAPPIREVFRFIWSQKALVHMLAASTLTAFAGYGTVLWQPVFLIRSFGLKTDEVGLALALIIGIGGGIGTYFGGLLADRLGRRDARWYLWIIAGAAVISAPFLAAAYLAPSAKLAYLFFIIPGILGSVWLGPAIALGQSLVKLRMRAVGSSIFLLIVNLIGLGLGPQAVGILSDYFSATHGNDGVRYALLVLTLINFWAAFHALMAARELRSNLQIARAEGLSPAG